MRTRSIQGFAFLWVALLGALLGGCRVAKGPAALSQESYVWQRQWTPVLDDALRDSASSVSGWRVLAAEANSTGTTVRVSIRPEELRRTGLPVVAVFRWDGHLARYPIPAAVMRKIVQAWRSAGIALREWRSITIVR